jgi:hypothetical protein
MSDLLDGMRREIAARLQELAPAVEEFERLQAAVAGLDGVGSSTVDGANTRSAVTGASAGRRGGRPRGSRNAGVGAGAAVVRGGARTRVGGRGSQAVSLIAERPGITIGELA